MTAEAIAELKGIATTVETFKKAQLDSFQGFETKQSQYDKRVDELEAKIDVLNLTGPFPAAPTDSSAKPYGLEFANPRPTAGPIPAELTKDWGQFIRSGMNSPALQAAMDVVSDPAGGFLVNPSLSRTINSISFEQSPVRQFARIIRLDSGDAYEEPITTSLAAATWTGETQTPTVSAQPDLKKNRIPLHELLAMPKSTQKLLDTNGFDADRWLTEALGTAFGITEAGAFINGNGVSKPQGFLTYTASATDDDTRAFFELQYIPTGVAGDFAAAPNGFDVFYDTVAKLKAPYRNRAVWMMNRTTIAAVMKEKDSNGQPPWQQSTITNRPSTILGFPVVPAEDMPDIAADSLSIAFGNFQRAYTIVDLLGMKILRDPFSDKPNVLFYSTQRVGGAVVDFHALKLIKFSAT